MQSIKCVVVGDDGVGKTTLMLTFDCHMDIHVLNFSQTLIVDGKEIDLSVDLSDIGDDLERLLSYRYTDVVLICFSLIDPASYENVFKKWYPDVSYYTANTPIVLVGTKQDLYHDQDTINELKENKLAPITSTEGLQMCREIHSFKYLECSALLLTTGLDEIFDEAIRVVIHSKKNPKNKSLIL